MKKYVTLFISMLLMTNVSSAKTLKIEQQAEPSLKARQSGQLANDPFANDPFFQSQNDAFKQMEQMHRAMNHMMQQNFARMQSSLSSGLATEEPFGSRSNVQIKEDKDQIVYKLKLPKGSDSKVEVSIKDGLLEVVSKVTQKIIQEENNSKRISYSRSSNNQSFQVPPGYDETSLSTNMKGTNLIITLKKKA
jgi:HSP20 family molecular chaperone IbpA